MRPVKLIRFEVRKPRSDPHPEKSLSSNWDWRQGLFLIFKDYQGRVFDWMPRWCELDELNVMRGKVEEINKVLARENNQLSRGKR